MTGSVKKYFSQSTEAAPLAVFRILFGLMMFGSIVRFWWNGWVEALYVTPKIFFPYYGFEWVRPLGNLTYFIFIICALAALFVAAGYRYRAAILVFFLSFTYIELMDKTTYLNHYYFISILSFLLIFLPAQAYFSIDAYRNTRTAAQKIPAWCIDAIKLLLGIVYVYAGLAKINSDWLLKAMPLKIWLPSNYDLPFLGSFLQQEWVHYFFSWAGMVYDLSIPFLLLSKRTRLFGFSLVVIFHMLTRVLFPIGMFPYIMIVCALIFFDAGFHHRILSKLSIVLNLPKNRFDNGRFWQFSSLKKRANLSIVTLFFVVQFLFPWRYLLYPGEVFWNEEGFRFSWRVMLMEKAGHAQFTIKNAETGKSFYVNNAEFLTPFQERQMATQPDFILQYAAFLANHFEKEGHGKVEVYVNNFVALNGRKSVPFVDPKVNLAELKDSFKPKTFLLPLHDKIIGL